MPRHRMEHEPRHRAPRPDRRVPFSAAPSRPPSHAKPSAGLRQNGTTVEATGSLAADSPRPRSHAKPSAEPGQLGRAFEMVGAEASERLHSAATRLRHEQRVMLTGAARGLMVSPWFAAGAGFVIAAGAFMYAPHASLNFDAEPGQTPCVAAGCPVQQKVPVIAGTQGALITATPAPSSPSPRGRHAAHDDSDSAPTFAYVVQPDSAGTYQMIITETSEQAIGGWQFSAVIPGATKVYVYDGTPQGSGTGGGDSEGGTNGDGPSPGLSGDAVIERGYDPATSLRVVVVGEGTDKTAPEDVQFHDAQGTFNFGQH